MRYRGITGNFMTIAERIRIEKANAVNFDAVLFMQIIEEEFKKRDCRQWLEVCACDSYKTYPSSRNLKGNFYVDISKDFPMSDRIGVPSEHIEAAWDLLKNEGFHLYRVNEHRMKVALFKAPYIHYGYNTWYIHV